MDSWTEDTLDYPDDDSDDVIDAFIQWLIAMTGD